MRLKKFIAFLFIFALASSAWADDYYNVAPKFTAPYKAGELKSSLLNEALAELNRIREIIGVPHNITLNDDYNNKAQHGAVLLDVINTLDHKPGKPRDMDQTFYELAYAGTSNGNLSSGWDSRGVGMNLIMALRGCMNDSDNYNISALGHRRWLMHPRMKQVGFGLSVNSGSGYDYAVTYVIEKLTGYEPEAWPITDEFISWPSSKNNNPIEYFNDDDDDIAWSITPNPAVFSSPTNATVTVTRTSDSKTWTFSSYSSDGYFNVNTATYGWDPCIIFRPDGISSYSNGDEYTVEVTGLTRKSGGEGTIKYKVKFGPFTGSATSKTETEPEETAEEIKNDPESLLPIAGETTKNNLAEGLKMEIEDINFITTVDSADIADSDTAIKFAKDNGFKITTNYSSITAKKGYNAFKVYVAEIEGETADDIKIYAAKKSKVGGSAITTAATDDEVFEAELFNTSGDKFDIVPNPIIVAVDIDEAGDYSVHLAEKDTSVPSTSNVSEDKTSGDKTADGDSDSGGCDSGYGVFALVTLLIFGIPRVKARWNK